MVTIVYSSSGTAVVRGFLKLMTGFIRAAGIACMPDLMHALIVGSGVVNIGCGARVFILRVSK